jgi:hypothetical protein
MNYSRILRTTLAPIREKLKLYTEPVTAAIDACRPIKLRIIILTEGNLWRSPFAESVFGRNPKNKCRIDIIFNHFNKRNEYSFCIPNIYQLKKDAIFTPFSNCEFDWLIRFTFD